MCFEKQCLSAVLKIELGIYSIDFDNRAKFSKNILERSPGPAFGGAPRALPRPGEVIFKIILKTDPFLKIC